MVVKIPVYVDLEVNLDPEDTQMLIAELSEQFAKSFRKAHGTGQTEIETESFRSVHIRFLTRKMASRKLQQSLRGQ